MLEIQSALDVLLPESVLVIDVCDVAGGCISEAYGVAVRDESGERMLFLKSNKPLFEENFQCEAEGLAQLANVEAVRVPKLAAQGLAVGKSWLVTDWVKKGPQSGDFFAKFGSQLARLHRDSRGDEIGWHRDNYLGSSKQINASRSGWAEFFASQRIEHQLRWAVDQGLVDAAFRQNVGQIVRRMPELLHGRDDYTSLLHGDLWSGNYLCDRSGEPVLIDPAVYRGCREAEFGMLQLFGSCPASFYESYQAAWPMPDDWERRVAVYVLYHLLNHLNLFGQGYLPQCRSVAAEVLRS
ncbi:fructosamine kinase family protein [Planctomycetes bacterium K23_9]|uniref:Fructosamine kinase n=1 Tax=Stieleria marina TaxID=1930275 RepID=A0A517NQ03_9BACT|nr:Fructosamine kinase [Planctomycetes bacterium K23_9]